MKKEWRFACFVVDALEMPLLEEEEKVFEEEEDEEEKAPSRAGGLHHCVDPPSSRPRKI